MFLMAQSGRKYKLRRVFLWKYTMENIVYMSILTKRNDIYHTCKGYIWKYYYLKGED